MHSTTIISSILIVLSGFLTACNSSQVLYDYYTKARFSEYETFSWLEKSSEAAALIAPVEEHIRKAVSQALESKGLSQKESGGELLLTYHIGEKAPIYPSRQGYMYWPDHWSYGGYYGGTEQFRYKKGTLIIDLINRRSNKLIWRGSAPKVISNAKTEKLYEKIDAAVDEIMANFPPPNS